MTVLAQHHVLVANWNNLLTMLIISIQHSSSHGISGRPVYHSWTFSCQSCNGNRLVTSVFYKPTDSHSYLLYSSSHPNHTKRSIPFSQFLRLCHLCSEDDDFHTNSLEMRDFVVQRGYPTSLLDIAFLKTSQIPRSETLTNPVTKVTELKQSNSPSDNFSSL